MSFYRAGSSKDDYLGNIKKLKNFKDYLAERLDPEEIAHMEPQANIGFQALKSLIEINTL